MAYKFPVILSASRMTDMPAFYPRQLIAAVEQRVQKGLPIHSLVLWTKHPDSLLRPPLCEAISRWKSTGIQIALQLTVTGFGGVLFKNKTGRSVMVEPNVPSCVSVIERFNDLIQLTGNPALITVRFDPVMKIGVYGESIESNLSLLPAVLDGMKLNNLRSMVYSFLEPNLYRKVERVFNKAELTIEGFSAEEKTDAKGYIDGLCKQYHVRARPCCVDVFEETACLDGQELNSIKGEGAEPEYKALHRRSHCGCTRSVDLGGWPPNPCYSGCLYCYARPVINPGSEIVL
ncbi:MAG: hypothetical protein CVU06_03025 [Bacteroidetes bacterium HGW-Bacteroidetes-22]|nr:MAG: hypothetical protein CVU06_03025 [Bacteroidetes bacterium HGW-Bacteroidetes-22]